MNEQHCCDIDELQSHAREFYRLFNAIPTLLFGSCGSNPELRQQARNSAAKAAKRVVVSEPGRFLIPDQENAKRIINDIKQLCRDHKIPI